MKRGWNVEIAEVTQDELAPMLDALAAVYRGAFTLSPYAETEDNVRRFVSETLPQHAGRSGFRLCIARERPEGPVAGFTYGYSGMPGQWWYETVSSAIGPGLTKRWMSNYFEFVEVAVMPSAQGQGIGGRLHDALLSGLPHRTAMLTAFPDAMPALGLYRNRGWQTVRERLSFPGVDRTMVLMGLELARSDLHA